MAGASNIMIIFSDHPVSLPRRDILEPKGPTIRHKDQAMRILGIGSQTTDTGTKALPLSKYSQTDLMSAFQKKATESQCNSQQLKNFHESYQVKGIYQSYIITYVDICMQIVDRLLVFFHNSIFIFIHA